MSVKSDNKNNIPSFINPYDTALMYREAWFKGPLPLPYKEKHPPPLDYTKRVSDYPTIEKIKEWIADGRKHNICVRLAGVDAEHELLGIDVDDYFKGDKKKNGWDQLMALEQRLGPLPNTWISSARTDGKSGIRYFRVPRGLAFRSKVDKDIEVIRKGHRFAVVWPSIHPDGGLYWWFGPGIAPDKDGRAAWNGTIPKACEFPILPDTWIDYLTNGRTEATDDELIDVDSSVDEIMSWAYATFHGDKDSPMCSKLAEKLALHKKHVEDEATSHDKLTNGQWNLIKLASEGHVGWSAANEELEIHFKNVTLARNKRGLSEVNGEIFRSRLQALRKIKGQVDERLKIGAVGIDPSCQKTGQCGSGRALSLVGASSVTRKSDTKDKNVGDSNSDDSDSDDSDSDADFAELDDIPKGALKGVPEYRTNDDGNAEHFVDMFSSLEIGPSVRFADGYGWIVWHTGRSDISQDNGTNLDEGISAHWQKDEDGNQVMRRMWQKVRDRQESYAEACFGDYRQKAEDFLKGQNNVSEIDVKSSKALYDKWNKWSEKSGNNGQAINAIEAVKSITGVTIDVNQLDQNPYLLGVANGIIELDDSQRLRVRPARPDDYITLNTGVEWHDEDSGKSVISEFAQNKWIEYLDTFLPDPELQRITQIVLGHALIGGNPEKIMVVLKGDPNTGKSTMIAALEAALGDYCGPVSQTIFQNHKLNPVLANSITKRIIVCSEFDEKDQLSASQVKRLTGGSDKIQAELKGSNTTVEGVPQFVPILATNEVPTIAGADKALQNRLFVIPFNVVPNIIDKKSANIITSVCGPVVLSWLIEGYKQYRQIGELPYSNEIKVETQRFVSQLDEVATFADECVIPQNSPEGYVSRKDMYAVFKQWWFDQNEQVNKIPSMPKFTRRMKALGYKSPDNKMRINKVLDYWFSGVKLAKPNHNVLKMPDLGSRGQSVLEISGTQVDE